MRIVFVKYFFNKSYFPYNCNWALIESDYRKQQWFKF